MAYVEYSIHASVNQNHPTTIGYTTVFSRHFQTWGVGIVTMWSSFNFCRRLEETHALLRRIQFQTQSPCISASPQSECELKTNSRSSCVSVSRFRIFFMWHVDLTVCRSCDGFLNVRASLATKNVVNCCASPPDRPQFRLKDLRLVMYLEPTSSG